MPSIIPKLLLSSQRTDLQIYKNYALIYASLTKADLVGAAEVGNFSYKTVRYVVEACINEKIDYVDVADDSAAVEILFEYDQRCKQAGITALICQGASPGTTNILALLGSRQLDKTNEIHTNGSQLYAGRDFNH